MDEREFRPIEPGMDVCDLDGKKIGTVAHVHNGGQPATAGPGGYGNGYIEVKTGFMGLGRRLYVPLEAVHDVTPGGVFLSQAKQTLNLDAWAQKPSLPEDTHVVAVPEEVAKPIGAMGPAAAESASSAGVPWEAALPYYRTRWEERYGAQGAQWEAYETRYRFTWEMAHRPEYEGRSWLSVQSDVRREWESRHPETAWEQAEDTIRDAWEHAEEVARTGR
jgi:hypothetical protein